MSKPSGTGSDDAPRAGSDDAALDYPSAADNEPVTEVIYIPLDEDSAAASAAALNDGRRYTAPGFDAGSTQIIDRVPDDETDLMTVPTQVFASSPRIRAAAPQEIPPSRPQRPSWLIPILVVVAALIAAAILGLVLMKRSEAAKASKENAVRTTIETFDTAVRTGDLATLRTVTCGMTRETYASYDDQAWADTYARVSAAKQYPVVASVDEVVVNGDHAEANVTSYMAFDPATQSIRSFDLQFSNDQWKICQSS